MKRAESGLLLALVILAGCLMLLVAGFFAYRLVQRRASAAAPAIQQKSAPLATRARRDEPPTSVPTRAPLPTNTLVVPRESINQPLLQSVEDKMSVLRNLMPRQSVPRRFLTGEELRAELQRANASAENPIERHLQLFLALGLLREQDDLGTLLAELNARSTSGLYSADDKLLFIVSDRWNMGASEEMTFAHEFTHAMQDQYFDLRSLERRAQSGDARLAIQALIEGDATLSMAMYASGNLSQTDVEEIAFQAARIRPDELPDVPASITRLTLFPYEAGLKFVQTLYSQNGSFQPVDAAYAIPPLSTEQIIHPEKYAAHPDVPRPVALPAMADLMAGSWQEVERGVLGEFLLGLYLEQRIPPDVARAAAAGWGGDGYSVLQDGEGRRAFVLRLVCDSPDDAAEFFRACSQFTAAGPAIEQRIDEPSRAQWRMAESEVYLSRREENALLVIAPDSVALNRAVAWFPGY